MAPVTGHRSVVLLSHSRVPLHLNAGHEDTISYLFNMIEQIQSCVFFVTVHHSTTSNVKSISSSSQLVNCCVVYTDPNESGLCWAYVGLLSFAFISWMCLALVLTLNVWVIFTLLPYLHQPSAFLSGFRFHSPQLRQSPQIYL